MLSNPFESLISWILIGIKCAQILVTNSHSVINGILSLIDKWFWRWRLGRKEGKHLLLEAGILMAFHSHSSRRYFTLSMLLWQFFLHWWQLLLIMVFCLVYVQVVASFDGGTGQTLQEEPFIFPIPWEKANVPGEMKVKVVVHFIGHYREPPLERAITITRGQSGC